MEQSNEPRSAQAEPATLSFSPSPLCRFDSRGDYLVENSRDQLAVGLSFLLRLAYRAHTSPRNVARDGYFAIGHVPAFSSPVALVIAQRALGEIGWPKNGRSPCFVALDALRQIGGAL